MKSIPISAAKKIATEFKQRQVILVCWDGDLTHVVTYGKTIEECDQAALGGDRVKAALGWPESLNTVPSRVTALKKEIEDLKSLARALAEQLDNAASTYNFSVDEALLEKTWNLK